MIENKTLGQILYEAEVLACDSNKQWQHEQWSDRYTSLKVISEQRAAGIAAVAEVVARRVMAERESAKPEAEFHDAGTITGGAAGRRLPSPRRAIGRWRQRIGP